jgi:hypothetical protein
VVDALKAHDNGRRSLWITGHSLGGALAMVTAAFLANVPNPGVAGVFTYGQPRVGDPQFRVRYESSLGRVTFRCVNDRDLVPHLPPRELGSTERAIANGSVHAIAALADTLASRSQEPPDRYEHAGQLRLLLPNGDVNQDLAAEASSEPRFLAQPRTARSLFLELPGLLVQAPELLMDHFPINPLTHAGYIERIEAIRE